MTRSWSSGGRILDVAPSVSGWVSVVDVNGVVVVEDDDALALGGNR